MDLLGVTASRVVVQVADSHCLSGLVKWRTRGYQFRDGFILLQLAWTHAILLVTIVGRTKLTFARAGVGADWCGWCLTMLAS